MLRIVGASRKGRAAAVLTAAGSSAAGAYYLASQTETGQGLRRSGQFWLTVAPVVFDYYWQLHSSSPYVKFQEWRADEEDTVVKKQKKELKKQELHQKHAASIFQVMLQLRGLYVKLGQVLSVTMLPIPQEYRVLFRTLQSDVPGSESFETVKTVLERELRQPVDEIFEFIDPVPCGAASIGQAHKARLITQTDDSNDEADTTDCDVIIKVQYPDAAWQIPADIKCIGDFLRICVHAGVVDESAARLSYDEFSRQFIAELDYEQERRNLQQIHASSLDPMAPYQKHGVVVPRVYPELCSSKVITMEYLPGPKLEEEARRQLKAVGIHTKNGLLDTLRDHASDAPDSSSPTGTAIDDSPKSKSWQSSAMTNVASKFVSVNSFLWTVRMTRRILLWTTAVAVQCVQTTSSLVPSSWKQWADAHTNVQEQAQRLALTKEWIDALFDVHGYQVFGPVSCFQADPHPGNVLIIDERKLGLIDFGQCKRLTSTEQVQVARLVVSVAKEESDEKVAAAFRGLGIQTKNNSTEFLAKFARLMFGPVHSYHLDHAWHKELHKQDAVTYFPNQLTMVYRASMLLRGVAISLQMNVSVADEWKDYAQAAIDRNAHLLQHKQTTTASTSSSSFVRRMTNEVAGRLETQAIRPIQ